MNYPNPYGYRDEVKVAVLADEMQVENEFKLNDVIWGFAAITSAVALLITIH